VIPREGVERHVPRPRSAALIQFKVVIPREGVESMMRELVSAEVLGVV